MKLMGRGAIMRLFFLWNHGRDVACYVSLLLYIIGERIVSNKDTHDTWSKISIFAV